MWAIFGHSLISFSCKAQQKPVPKLDLYLGKPYANNYGQWTWFLKNKDSIKLVFVCWNWIGKCMCFGSIEFLVSTYSAFSDLDTQGEHSRATKDLAWGSHAKRKWPLNKVSQLACWKRERCDKNEKCPQSLKKSVRTENNSFQ